MQVSIRKMGNSQGILIPEPILNLKQLGRVDVADLQVNGGVIEIRPPRRNPREGWARRGCIDGKPHNSNLAKNWSARCTTTRNAGWTMSGSPMDSPK
ncbi:MAG: hypothetical protein I8H91_11630 [Burkholderiales bacterium]|nr:hypothetical protein [Burkholderiales bacterium]